MSRLKDDLIYFSVAKMRDHANHLLLGEAEPVVAKTLRAIVEGCQEVLDQRRKELDEQARDDAIDREIAGLNE